MHERPTAAGARRRGEPAKRATEGEKRQQRDADERGCGGQVQTGNGDPRGSGSACIRSAAASATRAAAAAWRRFRAWRSCAREERPPRAQLQLAPAQPSYHCPERPRARVREALSLRSSFSPSPTVPSVASFFPSLAAARARARCMRSAAATATACASGVASGVGVAESSDVADACRRGTGACWARARSGGFGWKRC